MNSLSLQLANAALPLVIVVIGFSLMVRLISGRSALALVGGLAMSLVAFPFLVSLISSLPWWLATLIVVIVIMSLLRYTIRLLFGRAVADHVTGELVADGVRLLFKAALWLLLIPFRIIGSILKS